MKTFRLILVLFILVLQIVPAKAQTKPNVLFVLIDDLGYGHFAPNNDTLQTSHFNSYFVHLVDSLQKYSLDTALLFSKTATPTLSKLANQGILFTNAYTTSNICAPSRLGIATGSMQERYGMYTNIDFDLNGIAPARHLASLIKSNGYNTAHIGKWHIGKQDSSVLNTIYKKYNLNERERLKDLKMSRPEIYNEIKDCGFQGSVVAEDHPLNNGFDYYYGYNYWASQFYNSTIVWENFTHAGKQEGYNTDVFTDKALAFMKKSVSAQKPFYVQLHYHAVHDSLEPKAPDIYYNKFNSSSFTLNNFYAHLYAVDCNVNRIMQFLKSNKQFENTLIIFASDNGGMCGGSYHHHKTGSPLPGNAPFTGHKGTYHLGGFRVPMFAFWPDGIKKGARLNQMVSTMDILPTTIDVAGGKLPNYIDGKSLKSLFKNPDNKVIHPELIWTGIHSYKWGYLINKTTKTHSDESSFAPGAWVVIKGDYLLRCVGAVEPGIYIENINGREMIYELYNIKNDPTEQFNLVNQYPEIVKEMKVIYHEKSKDFKPPFKWDYDKWETVYSD